MAKTLLDGVNETLKRANIISGDSSLLTSLTDSGKQHDIDVTVQVINEGVDDLYSLTSLPMPKEQGESTIVLVQGQRDYALATDLIQLRWPLIDRTNTNYMFEFPGGYDALLIWDAAQSFTGLPPWASINPTNGELHVSHAPDAASAGRTYTYEYDKDLSLANATDAFPFNNAAFRAMVPVWVQLWKRERRNQFDTELYKRSLGRAAIFLTQEEQRDDWSPRGYSIGR